MKQFDEILRQQIKDAFSRYDASDLADTGWNAFLEKRKRRGIAGLILWAKAASVAVLITTGSLLTYWLLDTPTNTDAGRREYGSVVKESPFLPHHAEKTDIQALNTQKINKGDTIMTPLHAVNRTEYRTADSFSIVPPGVTHDSTQRIEVSPMSETSGELEEFMEANTEVIMAEQDQEPWKEKREKRTFLLAGMSGMMARAEDISTGVPGFSLGLYGEHKISRRWAIRPGIVLAMQNITMGTSAAEKSMNYSAPALNSATGKIESFEGNLHLLAMELPVNIVYTIRERGENCLYVSAGASTMVYLSQNVSGSFNNLYTLNTDNATNVGSDFEKYSSFRIESREVPFSHADFLGLVNFSAGYSTPFVNNSSLLIEPCIQLPVNTLTSLNLRIRYGGISMKIRFGQTNPLAQ